MSIKIEVTLDKTIGQITNFFDTSIKYDLAVKSARQALNKTATGLKSFSRRQITGHLKMKAKEAGDKIRIKRATGRDLVMMESLVMFSGAPLPLIQFVTGSKNPRPQKGIKVRRRKKVKVEIVRGRKITEPSAFIAKAKRKGFPTQVFRRKSTATGPTAMQAAPSIAQVIINKRNIRDRIERHAGARLVKEFNSAYNNNLARLSELK